MPTSIKYLQQCLSNANIKACLHAIRKCEGTDHIQGYAFLFGSTVANTKRFTDFSKHPNVRTPYTDKSGKQIITTAAGAYQITYPTYKGLCKTYGFADFKPDTQDLMALALIDGANCLKAVMDGKMFDTDVMDRLNNIWASLPAAGFNQPEKSIADVKGWYVGSGGVVG